MSDIPLPPSTDKFFRKLADTTAVYIETVIDIDDGFDPDNFFSILEQAGVIDSKFFSVEKIKKLFEKLKNEGEIKEGLDCDRETFDIFLRLINKFGIKYENNLKVSIKNKTEFPNRGADRIINKKKIKTLILEKRGICL